MGCFARDCLCGKEDGSVGARAEDQEAECVWPELPGLANFHRLAASMMKAGDGTSTAGHQLLPWALKAGEAGTYYLKLWYMVLHPGKGENCEYVVPRLRLINLN